jgi:AraC-like DNA-binding protein
MLTPSHTSQDRFPTPPTATRLIAPQRALQSLENITVLGERTRHWSVQAPGRQPQAWLENAPVCAALAQYDIIHLGIVEAFEPYRFARLHSVATELLACLAGQGRVLIDGEWAECNAGTAALMPQHSAVGYYSIGPEPWRLVWVCYQRSGKRPSLLGPCSPVRARYDPVPLMHAVEGLRQECLSVRDPGCMEHWAALIHRLVLRFAQPWQREDRLQALWEKVAATLDRDWTLDRLASEAGCCGEALRRRCQQQLGRSPMQHLTFLRLRRAADLLITTDHKVEYIASQVGYSDAFAFSAMFKKWTGCPPKEFREQRKPG